MTCSYQKITNLLLLTINNLKQLPLLELTFLLNWKLYSLIYNSLLKVKFNSILNTSNYFTKLEKGHLLKYSWLNKSMTKKLYPLKELTKPTFFKKAPSKCSSINLLPWNTGIFIKSTFSTCLRILNSCILLLISAFLVICTHWFGTRMKLINVKSVGSWIKVKNIIFGCRLHSWLFICIRKGSCIEIWNHKIFWLMRGDLLNFVILAIAPNTKRIRSLSKFAALCNTSHHNLPADKDTTKRLTFMVWGYCYMNWLQIRVRLRG